MNPAEAPTIQSESSARPTGSLDLDRVAAHPRQFASDNWAGICPEAWEALERANHAHAPAYGEDVWTQRAADLFRDFFETDCEVFFTFNGTAANSLVLASLCQSFHSVVCQELAHIETDECGAPEFYSNGAKILTVSGVNGKVQPETVNDVATRRNDIHYPKPRALSITQATEVGTVYTPSEIDALYQITTRHGLRLHMDGARFGNALATLGVAPRHLSWERGIDVLCMGGAKNGLPMGDAIVFFNKDLAEEFDYRCKQAGQLASKMRFLAAPWIGLLETGAYLRNALHGNAMAGALESELREMPGLRVRFPRQANAVFVDLPPGVAGGLRDRGWVFYTFIGEGGARFMCAWDTTEADLQSLVADLRELCARAASRS